MSQEWKRMEETISISRMIWEARCALQMKMEEARKSTDLTNLVMIFGLQKISLKILYKALDLPVIRWTALVYYTLHRQDDMMPELADLSVKIL